MSTSSSFPASQLSALQSLYLSTQGFQWRWPDPLDTETQWHFYSSTTNSTNSNSSDINPCTEQWQGVFCSCSYVLSTQLPLYNKAGELIVASALANTPLPIHVGNCSQPQPGYSQISSITALMMTGFRMKGTIPAAVSNLSYLLVMDFSGNELVGTVPLSVYQNMTQLEVLQLAVNHLTGTIPQEVSSLRSLQSIDVESNALRGNLDPLFAKSLPRLSMVSMGLNLFKGSLPETICNFPELLYFRVYFNGIDGSIPECFYSKLTKLIQLELGNNYLTGSLSNDIGLLTNLQILFLQNNFFSQTIPGSITYLRDLSLILLDVNHFTGSLDGDWVSSSLPKLVDFDVSSNYLKGVLLHDCQWPKVQRFLGYGNQFTGSIPSSLISGFSDIRILDLGYNKLTGTIPAAIDGSKKLYNLLLFENLLTGGIAHINWAAFHNFSSLIIFNNSLTGTLPESFGELRELKFLGLFYNNFVGTIPKAVSTWTSITQILINGNKFSGPVTNLLGPAMKNLFFVDAASNYFTGTIPYEAFAEYKLLVSFCLSSNCLHGSISEEVCNARTLTSFAIDGINTASRCRAPIFGSLSNILPLKAFSVKEHVGGTIPECLFTMKELSLLHLSGNQLTGSLPSNVSITPAMIDLSLSHNLLVNSIPSNFLDRIWINFDLSYNRLKGDLSALDSMDIYATKNYTNFVDMTLPGMPAFASEGDSSTISYKNITLKLLVNRITGPIPASLISLSSISILRGNTFGCNQFDRQLPTNDPYYSRYSCGSDSMNDSLALWFLASLVAISLLTVAIWKRVIPSKKLVMECEDDRISTVELQSRASQQQVPPQKNANANATTSVQNSDKTLYWDLLFRMVSPRFQEVEESKLSHVRNFHQIANNFRITVLLLTIYIVFVMLPMFVIVNAHFRTHDYSYLWRYSAVWESGPTAAGIFVVCFVVFLAINIYLINVYIIKYHVTHKSSYLYGPDGEDSLSRRTSSAPPTATIQVISPMPSVDMPSTPFQMRTTSVMSRTISIAMILRDTSIDLTNEPASTPVDSANAALPSPSYCFIITSRILHALKWSGFYIIDFLIVLAVDVLYVYTYVECSEVIVIVTQLLISAFKVVWTDIFVVKLLLSYKEHVMKQSLAYYNISYVRGDLSNDSSASTNISNSVSTPQSSNLKLGEDNGHVDYLVDNLHSVGQTVSIIDNVSYCISVKHHNEPLAVDGSFLSPGQAPTDVEPKSSPSESDRDSQSTSIADPSTVTGKPYNISIACLSHTDIMKLCSTAIKNKILLPCFAVSLISNSCFNAAIVPEAPVSSSAYYCFRLSYVGVPCVNILASNADGTSYSPSFIYSFQCASAFIRYYTPVFVYMAVVSSIIAPFVFWVLRYWYQRNYMDDVENYDIYHRLFCHDEEEEDDNSRKTLVSRKTLTKLSKQVLHGGARITLLKRDASAVRSVSALKQSYVLHFILMVLPLDWFAHTLEHFHVLVQKGNSKQQLVVKLLSSFAVLISFGALFPILSVILLISIYINTIIEEDNTQNLLSRSYALKYPIYSIKLTQECKEFCSSFKANLRYSIALSSLFLGYFAFDTLGDTNGWRVALAPLLVIYFFQFIIQSSIRIAHNYNQVQEKNHRQQLGDEKSLTKVMKSFEEESETTANPLH